MILSNIPSRANPPAPILCDHPKQPRPYTPARAGCGPFDMEAYLLKTTLCDDAKAWLRDAYARPSRSANGFFSNTVRVPDELRGHTITAESRGYEYPVLLTLLARPDVLCILEQPPQRVIRAKGADGRPFTIRTTIDFIVITTSGIEIIEVEPSAEIADLCVKSKNRYQSAANGTFRSKPVEAFFKAWGFSFHIITERNLDKPFVQAQLLFKQYVNARPPVPFTSDELTAVFTAVDAKPGLMVGEMPIEDSSRRAELALHLLANLRLFTHLSTSDMTRPQELRLYSHPLDEQAFVLLLNSCSSTPADLTELGYQLVVGAEIALKHGNYTVTDVSPRFVRLKGPDGNERSLSHRALLDLRPRIRGIQGAEENLRSRYRKAAFADRLVYLSRRTAITPYLPGGRLAGIRPNDRSLRRWRDAFLDDERNGLEGDLAIFPNISKCGNSVPRIDDDVLEKLRELKGSKSYKKEGGGHKVSWVRLQLIAAKIRGEIRGEIPHERTIYRHCRQVPKYEHAYATTGKRGAEPFAPIYPASKAMGSPHGQRNWQSAHVDTSELDLSLAHPDQDTKILKYSVCRMRDPFSGEILAEVYFEGSPNAMTIRELMMDCWRVHGNLPKTLICDWGSEHKNTWFEKSCASLRITIIYRPKSDPRKGAPVETSFSTQCRQLIQNLEGNTQLLQRARLITKAMDPKQFTRWTPEDLILLLEDDLFLRNELTRQRKPSPVAIASAADLKFGPAPLPSFTEKQVRTALLPFVTRQHKVSKRGTVQCFKKTYHSRELEEFAGQWVNFRSDPDDKSIIYVIPPRRRRSIECHAIDVSGPTADIVAVAERLDSERLGSGPFENATASDARRAILVDHVDAAEESMGAAQTAKRRQRPAKAQMSEPKIDKSKLLNFTLTPNA